MKFQTLVASPMARIVPLAVFAGVMGVASLSAGKTPAPQTTGVKSPSASTAVSSKIPANMAVATLGGGCFWSMEAIYSRLKGVQSATVGYAGGTLASPTYQQVGGGQTGHAESLQIVYDPKVISYAELVEVLLTVLDPTTLNRQGADVGTQYRSVIFTRSAQEQKIARDVIKKINAAKIWKAPVVTQIVPIKAFYGAEDYHRNYYDANQQLPYCKAVIVPKLDKLRAKFGDKLK